MGDRSGSFLRCAQVRTKVYKKDYDWSVGLVYDPKGLLGVTTVRLEVAGVLQIIDVGINMEMRDLMKQI
jgi:hypothetical protein